MEFIENQSLSVSEFERDAGFSNTYLKKTEERGVDISQKMLDKFREKNEELFLEVFPEEKESQTSKQKHINTRLQIKNGNHHEGSTPIYEDAPYTLSNIQSYRDQQIDEPDFWVTIPGLRKCNYGCRAVGDSMHPLIRSHALVVGEEIVDWQSFFPKGDIYIIRARNGTETVKYIQPHPTDDTKFLLVPYNKKAATDEIKKEEILQLFKAKAVFNVL